MGHVFIRPNVMPGMGVIRSPTIMQGYGTPSQAECSSLAGEAFSSSDSSGLSDTLSPGAAADEPVYLPILQKIPSSQDLAPPTQHKKRRGEMKEADQTPAEKKARKKRGRFELSERIETSITRSWGACLRCHNQRVRCTPNPRNPQDPDMPCQTCVEVDMSTKKAIHQLPCLRYRLQKIVMHRSGGLDITDRFGHNEIVDLFDYPDSDLRTLLIDQGICQNPICVTVRRFNPSKDDRLARVCAAGSASITYPLAPLCLADVEKTAEEFRDYLRENALDGLTYAVRNSDEFIKESYAMILKHYYSLPDEVPVRNSGRMVPNDEKKVLREAIVFWFALRHMIGSSWVCGGDIDGLWPIYPHYDDLRGKISTPRMIIAQFDSIQNERILKSQAPTVLKSLQKLYYTNNLQHWFTIYSVTFMLLHHVSLASADRKRWAEQRNLKETRYGPIDSPLTRYVEELQEGTTYLLAHWHYYKHCVDLLAVDWDQQQGESSLKHLTAEQTGWMKASCDMLRKKAAYLKNLSLLESRWEDELYFVSKMYEPKWAQIETFTTTESPRTPKQNEISET